MKQDTSKTRKYHHLGKDDRDIIAYLLARNASDSEIAIEIKRHRTTIWREKTRNRPQIRDVRYLAHRAHDRAVRRKQEAHEKPRVEDIKIRNYIASKIKQGYSPEQVAGTIQLEIPGSSVSHETIYQFIYFEARELIGFLRKQHNRRRKRGSGMNKRAVKVPNRVMIAERPQVVTEKKEYGHWEADTMVSRASKAALQVIYERKSMYLRLKKLERKTAEEMRKGLTRGMCRLPERLRKTITFDNGSENAEHEKVDRVLKTKSYFCNPYHSWEKGGIENAIGLIREYLPKRIDIAKIDNKEIRKIQRRLNNRPRKSLGYLTPAKVFRRAVALAA